MLSLVKNDELISIPYSQYKKSIEDAKKEAYINGIRDNQFRAIKTKDIIKIISEKDNFKKVMDGHCGGFYFYMYDNVKSLSRQNLFRLIYLCSYMDYNNMLSIGRTKSKKYITSKELEKILNLCRREVYSFKSSLIKENIITINKDKHITINNKYCKKGDVPNIKGNKVVRIYDDGIRSLYKNSTAKEHKKLGLLIELLPYINLKWNILCLNPNCEILDDVIGFSIKDICELVGYKNVTNLSKDLLSLTVNGEPVVAFIETNKKKLIAINPLIYYKGTRIEDLLFLISIFGMK